MIYHENHNAIGGLIIHLVTVSFMPWIKYDLKHLGTVLCYFMLPLPPPSMVMSLGKSKSAVQSTATLNFFSKLGKVDK